MGAEDRVTSYVEAPASHGDAAPAGAPDATFIQRRLEALNRRLVDQNLPIDAATLAEVQFLRDLAWLVEEHGKPPVKSRGRRFVVPLLFTLTALCVTALVFVRLPSIRIDADVICSAIMMRVAAPIQLTGLSRLSLLQASAFQPGEIEDPTTLEPFPLQPPLELKPSTTGSLTLSSVRVPAGALLSIEATADPNTWRVSIDDAAAAIGATLAGQVEVSTGGHTRTLAFGRGGSIELRAGDRPSSRVDALITPQRVESLLAGRRIPIRSLHFEEAVAEAAPGAIGIVQGRGSSVIEGSIFNVALAGRETRLRQRDSVELDLVDGDVRELRLEGKGVRVGLSGVARELQVGRFGGLQTLRPSYLEWIAEHHALKLAWGSAAWVFALFLGGLRWWQDLSA